jgi:hypothetical protein
MKYNLTKAQLEALRPLYLLWKEGKVRPSPQEYQKRQVELLQIPVAPHNLPPSPPNRWGHRWPHPQVNKEYQPLEGWATVSIYDNGSWQSVENAAIVAFRKIWNGWNSKEPCREMRELQAILES